MNLQISLEESATMEENDYKTRQERRERKLKKQREHMQKHGAGLIRVYRNAVEKRVKG